MSDVFNWRTAGLGALFLLLVALAPWMCQADGAAARLLADEGFTGVELTGWAPFRCSQHDAFSSGFTGINARGVYKRGVVCCGLLKSCTIRYR